jgi:4-amino-4-deoxy-L-arabinose transferase-like glycosyltransferase
VRPRRGRFAVLLAVTLLALGLRCWNLGSVPPGLDVDEVSIGYNAYAIARTGRDEYGETMPLLFRAYGEYKRPLYIYAAAASVAVMGPSESAIRVPAALFGALSVPVLYAVVVLLFKDWRLGIAAATLLAVSPWHVQFTRAAREVSVLVLAVLLMAAALLAAFRARGARAGWLYVGASVAFLAALYSATAGVIFAPALGLLLVWVYRRDVMRAPPAWLGGAVVIAAAGCLPVLTQFAGGQAAARFGQISVFSDEEVMTLSAKRIERDKRDGVPELLNNPWVLGTRQAADVYLSHFDPTYLFTIGDPEWRHHSSDTAQLYLWELPLVLAGLYRVAREWHTPPARVIAGWLLLGPLPGAFAVGRTHAVHSITMLPALYMLAAVGLPGVWQWLRARRLGTGLAVTWALLFPVSVAFYLFGYHRYYPVEHADSWGSGQLETYRAAQEELARGRIERVVVPHDIDTSYIYALFGTGYDPRLYLAAGGTAQRRPRTATNAPGPMTVGAFEFRDVDWGSERRSPTTLYVLCCGRGAPGGNRVVRTIYSRSGREAARLVVFD